MVDPQFLVFPLFVALAVAIAAASAVTTKRKLAALADALAPVGFAASPPSAFSQALKGSYRGRAASVTHEKHGKNGPWTTDVAVAFDAPEGFRLDVRPEGVASAIAKAFGGQDVQVGDAEFDAAFRVMTPDETRATFVLGASERRALLDADPRRLHVAGGALVLELKGRRYDADSIGAALAFLEKLATRAEATR